jgi:flagellar biosynthesis protein FliQ
MLEFEFLESLPVFTVLVYVVVAIFVDAIFGAILSIKEDSFDLKELPRFLGTNLLPYVVGLFILAVVAEYQGEVFQYLFYTTAMFVIIRYIAKLKEKIEGLFNS